MGLYEQFPYTNFQNLNLDWVIKILKDAENVVNDKIPGIETAISELKKSDQDINKRIDDVIKKIDTLVNDDTILKLVIDAIDKAIKMVFFGLTDDGYFCAYIPQSWSDIQFGTIMDFDSENFGKLTLSY